MPALKSLSRSALTNVSFSRTSALAGMLLILCLAFAMPLSAQTSPLGFLDSAVNAANQTTTTVPQNGMLQVSGWAAAQDSATLMSVAVSLDGNFIGNATLGPGSGWTLSYNIGTLAAGSHWVVAVATDSNNATTNLSWSSAGAGSFTVVIPAGPPQGYVDHAVNASNPATTTVPQNGTLQVSGWASAQGAATLTKVAVSLDGSFIGNATLGTGSSWTFGYNIGTLAAGNHWVAAVATDSNNATTNLSWSSSGAGSFTVATAAGPPQGYLDHAVNASNPTTTTVPQNGMLQVSGWASPQGTATLTTVAVSLDGSFIGNATLGTGSSWTFGYNIGTLAAGSHWVAAVATDSNNATTNLSWSSAGAGSFTAVVPAAPPQGFLDSAVNASNPTTTTVPQNGMLQVSGWASAQGTATLTTVAVSLDGSFIGNATLGTGSSWTFSYNIGTLAAGSHWVAAVATDSNNTTTNLSWSSAGAGSFTAASAGLQITGTTPPNGTTGISYGPWPLGVSGGTAPYTWSISAGSLPPGLTLSAATISGMPQSGGTFSFTVKVTDSSSPQNTGTANMSITINALQVSQTANPTGAVGVAYSFNGLVLVSGGTAPYSYSVTSGTVPPGLTFSNNNISGTPTASATPFNFTVTVKDSSSPQQVGSAPVTLNIFPAGAVTITTNSLPSGTQGSPYPTQTLQATGGVTPYTWSINSGSLPPGLSLVGNVISGTPPGAALSNGFTVQVTDSSSPSKRLRCP